MKHLHLFITFALIAMLSACSDDTTNDSQLAEITIMMKLPEVNQAVISNATVSITDVNTQQGKQIKTEIVAGNSIKCQVAKNNLYNFRVNAYLQYEENGKTYETIIQGTKDNITVNTDQLTIEIPMYKLEDEGDNDGNNRHKGFVLAEIFCAGTTNMYGAYYYADKYFVIYNNTDHVLYADSLLLLESDFLTVNKQNYIPDIMNDYFAVGAVYMIPGNGKDHPVQPGERILIVDNAIDHTYANPNSWDMTVADYEWYDESTNPQFTDIDNPDVKNLKRIYCYTRTTWSPHTQGFRSYAIATMKTDEDTFINDYYYDYEYHLVGQTGEADMTGTCYKVPNEWIVDAVNMSSQYGFQWIVTAPSLDQGFTYNSEFNFDDTRFNKSARRKVSQRIGDRTVLQDTNNSSDDFEPRVQANPFHKF